MGIKFDRILLSMYVCLKFKLLAILFNFMSWKYLKISMLCFFPLSLLGCFSQRQEPINLFCHLFFTAFSYHLSQFVIITCVFTGFQSFQILSYIRKFYFFPFYPLNSKEQEGNHHFCLYSFLVNILYRFHIYP